MRICACIVTYNRRELLLRNIRSIDSQTVLPDILVLDNASTDHTREYLEENGYFLAERHRYLRSSLNTGGSGGFYQACSWALQNQYDYVWLMDDDGYCMNDSTLSSLLQHIDQVPAVLNSVVLRDPQHLTFQINGMNLLADLSRHADHGCILNAANPYNGTLIPAEILKAAGLPKKEFFIYGDETEYIHRIEQSGFHAHTVLDSLYYHPVNNPDCSTVKFLGRESRVIIYAPWKLYCFARNYCYIYLTYFSRWEAEKFILSLKLQQRLLRKNTAVSMRLINAARHDALANDFSRDIPALMKTGDIQ